MVCACSDEETGDSLCPQNVQLKWTTEVSSSIYATPTITDLYSDAHKDIIVPAFVNQLEVCSARYSTNVFPPICNVLICNLLSRRCWTQLTAPE